MTDGDTKIQHVSDTAIWVAYYRALESDRRDALFQDRLAKTLIGERGEEIAGHMNASHYTQWSVVIRTHVIDRMIESLVASGVDTVLNLGAGLDTRPYRLSLPENLRWIEVDHSTIVEHKDAVLASERPGVRLERISLDLADTTQREQLFARVGKESRLVLVLMEGVLPYLTVPDVESLADALRRESTFRYWIAEYFSPGLYPYFQSAQRQKQMKNAPIQFFPADWFGLFASHGWLPREIKYLSEEAAKVRREIPFPWWARFMHLFLSKDQKAALLKNMGYVIFESKRDDKTAPSMASQDHSR